MARWTSSGTPAPEPIEGGEILGKESSSPKKQAKNGGKTDGAIKIYRLWREGGQVYSRAQPLNSTVE